MKLSSRPKANIVLSFIALLSLIFSSFIFARSVTFVAHASHLSQTSSQSDWPMFGYDPQRTNYNPNETMLSPINVSSLQHDWQATTPGIFQDTSSPVIANGIVYIGDNTDTLYAYNATTGTLLWTYSMPPNSELYPSPTVVNGIAYVDDDSGNLVALDASTGSLLWTTKMPGGSGGSSPVVVNNVIYVSLNSQYASLTAFNATNGSLLWSQHFTDYMSGSPAIANGVVYATTTSPINGNYTDYGNLYALDAQTGNILWSGSIFAGANGPAVSNGIVYIHSVTGGSPTSSNLYAFNASGCGSSTCSPLWVVTDGTLDSISPRPSPAIANGVVYIGTISNGYPVMSAFDANTGATLWTWTGSHTGSGFNSSPAVANGVIYDATEDGNLYAFNASGCGHSTCAPIWTYNMGTSIGTTSSPAVVNGMVYIGAFNGASPYNGLLFAFNLPNIMPSPSPSPSPTPSPNPSVTLSVSIDDISCLSTLKFSVQNAKPDQIRVSRNGQFITKLAGNAKTYTDVATGTFAGYGYELYEVAAFKTGRFLALARSYIPVNQSCFNGKTPPGYPKPPIADSQNDLFFIVGGINSTLSANTPINSTDTQAAGNNGYGYDPAWETYDRSPRIASYLMWNGYLNSRFIIFSYSSNATTYTNDGMPKSFTCQNTFDNWTSSTFFQQEVLALSKQIQAAVAGRKNIRLHILAHSQGGLLALAYTFALAKNLDSVTQLPPGVTLHDIDLYDSPVGGTLYDTNYLSNIILKLGCLSSSKYNNVKQMHKLFLTATDKTEYGKSASIVGSFFGLNPKDPNNSNQSIAVFTHGALGVTIFIAGNDNDYLWQPQDCGGGANFRSTENLINDEANGLESRRFTSTFDVLGCVASESNTLNHLDVLLDPNVQQATLQVVQGITPGLTPYTG